MQVLQAAPSDFVARGCRRMEQQILHPFAPFGRIIGVARLHPFCLPLLSFVITPPVVSFA